MTAWGCEVLQQRDFPISKRADLLAIYDKRAKKSALLPQRNAEQATRAAQLDLRPCVLAGRVGVLSRHVREMGKPLTTQETIKGRTRR